MISSFCKLFDSQRVKKEAFHLKSRDQKGKNRGNAADLTRKNLFVNTPPSKFHSYTTGEAFFVFNYNYKPTTVKFLKRDMKGDPVLIFCRNLCRIYAS